MSWILNVCVISALIIMILHCFYNYWSEGHVLMPTTDLVDLKTQKYKNIIETLIKEKERKETLDQDMDNELMEYMQSKFADNSAEK
jgi:hypothetical protein